MKNSRIRSILVACFIITVCTLLVKESFSATNGNGAVTDWPEINIPENFALTRSMASIYWRRDPNIGAKTPEEKIKKIKNWIDSGIPSNKPDITYDQNRTWEYGWQGESAVGEGNDAMIYKQGALCYGHEYENGGTLKKITILDIDEGKIYRNGELITDSYNKEFDEEYKLAYYIYNNTTDLNINGEKTNRIQNGGLQESASKLLIARYCNSEALIERANISQGNEDYYTSSNNEVKLQVEELQGEAENYTKIISEKIQTENVENSRQAIQYKQIENKKYAFIGPYNIKTTKRRKDKRGHNKNK